MEAPNEQLDTSNLISTTEAARMVNKHITTITHAIRVGALPAIKEQGIKGKFWISVADLRAAYPTSVQREDRHRPHRRNLTSQADG